MRIFLAGLFLIHCLAYGDSGVTIESYNEKCQALEKDGAAIVIGGYRSMQLNQESLKQIVALPDYKVTAPYVPSYVLGVARKLYAIAKTGDLFTAAPYQITETEISFSRKTIRVKIETGIPPDDEMTIDCTLDTTNCAKAIESLRIGLRTSFDDSFRVTKGPFEDKNFSHKISCMLDRLTLFEETVSKEIGKKVEEGSPAR